VLKVAGSSREKITGPARVFENEEAPWPRPTRQQIKAGDVVVIRYEGPKGGPGMREMLGVTGALAGQGLADSVALLTDGRFSGATRGSPSATWRPRRSRAACIAFVREGDTIVIDVPAREIARRDRPGRAGPPQGRLDGPGPALRARRHGQVCQHRFVGRLRRRRHLDRFQNHA